MAKERSKGEISRAVSLKKTCSKVPLGRKQRTQRDGEKTDEGLQNTKEDDNLKKSETLEPFRKSDDRHSNHGISPSVDEAAELTSAINGTCNKGGYSQEDISDVGKNSTPGESHTSLEIISASSHQQVDCCNQVNNNKRKEFMSHEVGVGEGDTRFLSDSSTGKGCIGLYDDKDQPVSSNTSHQSKSKIPVSTRDLLVAKQRSPPGVGGTSTTDGILELPSNEESAVGITSPLVDKVSGIHRTESINSIKSNGSESQRSSASVSRNNSISEVSANNNIKVVIRVRPLGEFEKKRGDQHAVENPEKGVIWVNRNHGHTKPFCFTTVCGEHASQEEVFNSCGIKDLIEKALEGFSCTAFAFGQTGSGKTYTITGPVSQDLDKLLPQEDLQGLLPRSFQFLFDELAKQDHVYIVRASFLEVYNEKVQDLLNPSNFHDSLPVRWSSERGFHVENLFTVECDNLEDMLNVLNEGLRYRQMGVHALNEHSSRSHSMLTIYIDSEMNDPDEDFPIVKHGKISFVDLAGSERVKESKVSGEALTESQNINKSLLTLGNCIAALGDPKKRNGHIPYRDSKLTKLLADSLGGDGFTLMIACISPSVDVIQDTLNTLRYANRAKNIKNKPVVRMDPREQLIMRLKRDIKLLKSENAYFREQVGVPSSDSQLVIPANHFEGIVSPSAQSGTLSSAIGTNSLSSLHSNNNNNKDFEPKMIPITEGEDNRATTAMYAMTASFGLYDMLQGYMNENENLRTENLELHQSRAVIQREHEMLSRENERLARKLEELESFVSSPTSPGQQSDAVRTVSSREGPSPWSIIRQRYLTLSGKEGPSPDDQASKSKSQEKEEKLVFPPLPKGTYPNYTAQDLSEDFAMESRKLKEERARKEQQAKSKNRRGNRKVEGGTTSSQSREKVAGNDYNSSSVGDIKVQLLEKDDDGSDANVARTDFSAVGNPSRAENDSLTHETKETKIRRRPPVHRIRKQQYVHKEKKKSGYAALFATRKDKGKSSDSVTPKFDPANAVSTSAPAYFETAPQTYDYTPRHSIPPYYSEMNGYTMMSNSVPHDLQDLEGRIRGEFLQNQRQKFQ